MANSLRLLPLASFVIVVAGLYFARPVLIPFALATLLSFLLAPLVARLERWRVPRVPAVLIVAAFSFAAIGSVGWIVVQQAVELADKIPNYRENIRAKMSSVRHAPEGSFSQATKTIQELGQEIGETTASAQSAVTKIVKSTSETTAELGNPFSEGNGPGPRSATGSSRQPISVEIAKTRTSPLHVVQSLLGPAVNLLGGAGAVVIFVIFMLIQKEDFRDRLIRLAGQGKLTVTTQMIDDAARRVSRYLLMQMVVNVTYGLPIGIGLYFIGLPNAALWGILATLLRFIPFAGPWIAASMPLALSLAVFNDWTHLLFAVALFIVVELISNHGIEPWLYGTSTGVSPLGLIAAAVFWTWLWGVVGLLLSTPMITCLVVLGKHLPHFEMFSILFGNEPVLSPESRLYQRLLAGDHFEAAKLVEKQLSGHGAGETCDSMLIPALALAEKDRHQGLLDDEREELVFQSIRELAEDLEEHEQPADSGNEETEDGQAGKGSHAAPEAGLIASGCVLCLPARGEADEIAAAMLAQELARRGYCARALPVAALAAEMLDEVAADSPCTVCISAMPPYAITHARYLSKRLRARFSSLRIVSCLWHERDNLENAQARMRGSGTSVVVTTIKEALGQV